MALWTVWKSLFMMMFSLEFGILAEVPYYDSQGLQWKCLSTDACIWNTQRCDGKDDCDDESDEENCVCPEGMWKCHTTNTCIWNDQRCNGQVNCANDESDEENCLRCKGFSFHCNNNKCISGFLTCNGKDDCGDNSDETANCPPESSCDDLYYWRCKDTGKCVLDSNRCNGEVDCNDGSDEVNCDACKDNAFLCKNRKCISIFLVCNEINNCGDDSDESCAIPNTGLPPVSLVTNTVGKFTGGIIGGAAGFIMLLVAIIIITIVICVCNKRCPLYKRRQREQPPVVVIDGAQPAPEENAHESLSLMNNDQCNTQKGIEDNHSRCRGIAHCHDDWYSNIYLDY